jgi:formylglycine-generating enzyme required for sulfatase activity
VYSDCAKTTAPAESRPLNPSGVRNMAGNVWEWTTTLEGEDLVVVRGGSFRNNARDMRADRRSFVGKPTNTDGAGFRCVRNP